jgi:Rho-binding antiterminator
MTERTPISCHIHDYIEIACLYSFEIQITLDNGEIIQGQAMTTLTSGKREYLVLKTQHSPQRVELGHIKAMQALTANTHFERIEFD